jgi:hypothetical protein
MVRVAPEVIAFRKAELMLMMFGPKELADWQKVALHEHYGTWDMERCWIMAQKKFKAAEDRSWLRPCRECHEEYDPRTREDKAGAHSYCSDACDVRQSIRTAIAHPEETKGWLWV